MSAERGVLVVGAGGHGKVAADIVRATGQRVIGFLDDDPSLWGMQRVGLPVLGAVDTYGAHDASGLVMGIGDNKTRATVARRLGAAVDTLWRPAIHPGAIVAPSVRIGKAAFIGPGAVINCDTVLGDFVVVNTGATVDHDCALADFVHVAPGVHLSGGVRIAAGALLGVGCCVAPGRAVGEWAIVGAGAAAVRDVPGGVTAKGVPARW